MHVVSAAYRDAVLLHVELDRLESLARILRGVKIQISRAFRERLEVCLAGVVVPEVQVADEILVTVVERTPAVLLRVRSVVVVYRDYLDRVRRAAVEDNRPHIIFADLVAPYIRGICALPLRGIRTVFRRGIDAGLRAFPVGRVSDALRRAESAAVHAAALEEGKRTRRKILLLEPLRRAPRRGRRLSVRRVAPGLRQIPALRTYGHGHVRRRAYFRDPLLEHRLDPRTRRIGKDAHSLFCAFPLQFTRKSLSKDIHRLCKNGEKQNHNLFHASIVPKDAQAQ